MYIQPNSTIYIYHGIPLDNTYTDTIYFSTEQAQQNFFLSDRYNHILFTQQSYVRQNKNRVRLDIPYDSIYNYNYMSFRNTAYGTKWFYAFITDITYINNNCTEIEFEIDVMQTWLFEVTLDPCLVEREHTATDVPGENLALEPVDLGMIVCNQTLETEFFDSYHAVIGQADSSTT